MVAQSVNELEAERWRNVASYAMHGDEESWAAMVAHFEHLLMQLAMKYLADWDRAEEAVAETWYKAWRARDRFDCRHIAAWLSRILVNTCLDVLRRDRRIRFVSPSAKQSWLIGIDMLRSSGAGAATIDGDHIFGPTFRVDDDPERMALSHEAQLTVQRVLNRMTARHRVALVLREYQGMSCTEIGGLMHLSRTAVKSLLFRSREEFRREYAVVEAERRSA